MTAVLTDDINQVAMSELAITFDGYITIGSKFVQATFVNDFLMCPEDIYT